MRKELPHCDEAERVKNSTIVSDSVYEYIGPDELFCFLGICKRNKNTAYFKNEDLTIPPECDTATEFKLVMMSWLSTNPIELEQYLRYRDNLEK